jgi:tyrosyl-tRNA synthetase
MTLDILPGTDGVERMSKSTGNYIGVTDDPRDVYGKVMSVPDDVMMTYFRLLTAHHADELAAMEERLELRRPQSARPQGAARARDHRAAAGRRRGGRGRGALRPRLPPPRGGEDLQELALEPGDLEDDDVFLPAVMERWFGQTRSEWRRRIQQGGVSLDGEPVTSLAVPAAALAGRRLKAGKSAAAQGLVKGL